MKNLGKGFIALMLAFSFTSCESDQEPLMSESKLNSYKLERSENGTFTIEYTTNDGYSAESVENISSSSLDVYFDGAANSSELTQERLESSSNVKVNFIGLETDRNEFISIQDDDITSFSQKGGNPLLKAYYVHRTFTGSYIVFFKVKNGVDVSYQYNEELGENEILLMPSEGRRLFKDVHAQVYRRPYGEDLKITFMSPVNDSSSKFYQKEDDLFRISYIRKPRIIITE